MFTSKGTVDVVPPSRIVTIFVYLNTMPEGEGYTEFPHLGLTIRPEKCSAIMFCNFLPNGQCHSLIRLYALTHLLTHLLTYWLTHSLTHLLTHLLTLTHSFIVGDVDNRVTHAGRSINMSGIRKWGLNIWVTDCNIHDKSGEFTIPSRQSRYTCLLTHSLTYLLTGLLTHLTHSFTNPNYNPILLTHSLT